MNSQPQQGKTIQDYRPWPGLVALGIIFILALMSCTAAPDATPEAQVTDTPTGAAACPPSVILPDDVEVFLKRNSRNLELSVNPLCEMSTKIIDNPHNADIITGIN